MKNDEEHRGLRRYGIWGAAVVGGLLTAVVFAVAWSLNGRVNRTEDRMERASTKRYSPPDLGEFAADDDALNQITVQQTIYVPVYSHVYFRSGAPYQLETTLSIRNTDLERRIFIPSVRYYDTKGKLVKKYVDRIIQLKPLETIDFLVPMRDTAGGSGANFIVEWYATEHVNQPIVEAVMVGTAGTQAICFRSSGKVVGRGDSVFDSLPNEDVPPDIRQLIDDAMEDEKQEDKPEPLDKDGGGSQTVPE